MDCNCKKIEKCKNVGEAIKTCKICRKGREGYIVTAQEVIEKVKKQESIVNSLEQDEKCIILMALEKQIPQNPIKNEEYYSCPCCGYEFPDIGGVAESYGESEKYNHCPECGQAINYEE